MDLYIFRQNPQRKARLDTRHTNTGTAAISYNLLNNAVSLKSIILYLGILYSSNPTHQVPDYALCESRHYNIAYDIVMQYIIIPRNTHPRQSIRVGNCIRKCQDIHNMRHSALLPLYEAYGIQTSFRTIRQDVCHSKNPEQTK